MALRRLHGIRILYRTVELQEFPYLFGISRDYSNSISNDFKYPSSSSCLLQGHVIHPWSNEFSKGFYRSMSVCTPWNPSGLLWTSKDKNAVHVTMVAEFSNFIYVRLFTTQAKPNAQVRQMGALKTSIQSPGIVYEPYSDRGKIPFWKRWFTRSGWRRTKEDIMIELKNAYAIAKLRKAGYSKKEFYAEAFNLYKEISTQIANGDKTSLRKLVTENMYSALKNEIKRKESRWSRMDWELLEPVVKMRTLRARMIGIDRDDLSKVFVQLTLEFLTKQKFAAYDSKGTLIAGNKDKEVLVREIWVFEKSLFHHGAYWRLCGRIVP